MVLLSTGGFCSFVECESEKMAVYQNLQEYDYKLENIKRHVILKRHSKIEQ